MKHTARTNISLDDFRLRGMPVGSGDPEDLMREPLEGWLPVRVPGGVHEALIEAGQIEHPYVGDNERKAAWVEEHEWWYRADFAAPVGPGIRQLIFDGLDTVADVWLNGRFLGSHENMFRPAEFEIELAPRNVLLVRFSPPLAGLSVPPVTSRTERRITRIARMLRRKASDTEPGTPPVRLAIARRKAAFSWGWDFGPNLPSIGIWRPVRIESVAGPALSGHHIALTHLSDDRRHATATIAVEAPEHSDIRVTLTSPSGRVFSGVTRTGRLSLDIEDPELWWTHDLGEQALHDVVIELILNGETVDRAIDRVGLRTIELDQSRDRGGRGRLFRFVLNGMPIFARGANWLPASMFVGSVAATWHYDLVQRAREGNLTMLRVWGGGIYEQDSFYQACDELGVLVWQDFMFACNEYPSDDPQLQSEVQREATYQVRRLRNRACLAIWVGNNEVHLIHAAIWLSIRRGGWGWHFFHKILPEAVAQHDGITPYWPGSPYGRGGIFGINGTRDGDRHTWEVWHGLSIPGFSVGRLRYRSIGDSRHYRRFADDTGKFTSEFGIHASPELATLRRWIHDDDLQIHSPVFDQHQKDVPKNKGDELLSVTSGIPTTMEEYVAYTQAVQAERMAFAIEHYRSRQPHSGGALIWQFNDVWPGFSWSIIDHDGVPKAAYYAAARASAPIAVAFTDGRKGLRLWLMNNGPYRVKFDIDVELGAFDGSERRVERVTVTADAGSSVLAWAGKPRRDAHHYAWASSPTESFLPARKHFAEIGELELGESTLESRVVDNELHIRSTGYNYSVRINHPVPGIRLSDNCFDMRDGDTRAIAVSGIDPAVLTVTTYPHAAKVSHP